MTFRYVNPMTERRTPKIVGITVAAAMGGFLFGYDSSVVNGAVDAIQRRFALGSFATGLTVAIALLGCAAGSWFAGRLADRWGRRPVMVLSAGLFVASSLGSSLAVTVPQLVTWRLVGGVGVGLASVIAPAYIAEIAPARWRGGLGSVQQLAITLGIFSALTCNAVLQHAAGGASARLWFGGQAWRWMFVLKAVPALVYGALSLRVPESPRYLVGVSREREASSVLSSVTGEPDPRGRVSQIRQTLDRERPRGVSDLRGSCFGLHKVVWVGVALAALQQLVGINAIFYYSTTLWRSVGFSEAQSFTTSVATAVLNVAMTVVALLLIDRIGRRTLLLAGSAGMCAGLVLTAMAFSRQIGTGADVALPGPFALLALVGANVFVVCFAATWGPVLWVMLGEMFPNQVRVPALGVSTAANWATNFLVTLVFPPLTRVVGLGAIYGGFAFFAVLSFFFVRAHVPETVGVALEDMSLEAASDDQPADRKSRGRGPVRGSSRSVSTPDSLGADAATAGEPRSRGHRRR